MGRKPETLTKSDDSSRRKCIAELEATFAAKYDRFQYVFVNFLAEHLSETSRTFGGDMQKVLILAIIGQVHLNAQMANNLSGKGITDLLPERRGITTNRIADVTGISRETTRRKVLAMEKSGWLVREEGYWTLAMHGHTSVARESLLALDNQGIKRGASLYWALSKILEN